jgi:hypothetical protein
MVMSMSSNHSNSSPLLTALMDSVLGGMIITLAISIGNVEHMLGMVGSGFILPALGKKPTTLGRGKLLFNFVCKKYSHFFIF